MAAKLVAEEGLLKGLVLSLEEGEQWVIGRDPDACQLLIEDPSASRKHMVCRTTPQGILVENLSSTNPVQVNDVELKAPQLLHNGDAVKIGSGIFRFYAEAAAQLYKEAAGEKHVGANGLGAPENETVPANPKTPAKASEEEDLPDDESIDESLDELLEEKTGPAEAQMPPADSAPVEPQTKGAITEDAHIADTNKDAAQQEQEEAAQEEFTADTAQAADSPVETAKEEVEATKEENELPSDKEGAQPESTQKENESLLSVPPGNAAIIPEELFEEEVEDDADIPHDSIFNEEATEKDALAEINFGLLDTGRWLLKVIGGPNNGAEFSMVTDASYTIGTDPNSCDIVFHDTSVSRQHARIIIAKDDTLTIEDLKSRNGTLVDGEPLKGKQTLAANTLVSLGTTSFVVFDREGEMQTIISPLLPSIVKVLQKDEPKVPVATTAAGVAPNAEASATDPSKTPELGAAKEEKPVTHPTATIGAFILIGILTGLFVIVGIGTTTLFKSEPVVVKEQVDPTKLLDEALAPFAPNVKYTFNKGTGRLLLVGHVLTATDKNQLLYTLQGLKFVKNLDDSGIVIDEYVWNEINQVLGKNPSWKGITVQSPSAGHFILSGYLQTRAQAARLDEYMSSNFPYLDLLEKRIVVDEEIVGSVNNLLDNMGFKEIKVKLDNGEVTLSGKIPLGKSADVEALMAEIKSLPGIRSVRNFLTEVAPEQSMINISNRYEVTGFSNQGGTNLNVVVNGRILMKGDVLDGMTITSIQSNVIMLEKDGIKYRIDFSK